MTSSNTSETENNNTFPDKPAWGAVCSMALVISGLLMSELLPVSLLTPMAHDLHVTEGIAGQAVTVTSIIAFFSSLFGAVATRRIDRRNVMLFFSVMLVVSNIVVAYAPTFTILMIGRVILGISLGGFWAMAAAIAMRLVPPADVPRAFSIIFGGGSAAIAIAAPIGSYLGGIIGWRGAFLVAAALGTVALIWQFFAMPSVPPTGQTRLRTLSDIMKRPQFRLGIFAVLLIFAGHFAFFTYLRPFLETVTHVGVNGISGMLLGFGIANFLGTSVSGQLLGKNLRTMMFLGPMLMAALTVGLVLFGANLWATSAVVALWGFAIGTVPVAWSTWVSHTVPDEPESAGGIFVASIQFAITIGAAAGGVLFETSGVEASFIGGGILLVLAVVIILSGIRAVTPVKNDKVNTFH
ncbi:MAG TPA: MFS transporter [Flavobacterium sp.]|jgi:predicted MFS family arabinose efflux permease